MATAVQSLLVEMDARTAKLDAALAAVTQRINAVKQSTEATSTAGAQLGGKYAAGALRAAGALETMARSGEVAGGSAKTLLSTVSNIAFSFGAGGALVGAAGVAGLALVQMFSKAREEAEKANAEFAKTIDAIGKLSTAGAVERLNEEAPKRSQASRAMLEAQRALDELQRSAPTSSSGFAGAKGADVGYMNQLAAAKRAVDETTTAYVRQLAIVNALTAQVNKRVEIDDAARRFPEERRQQEEATSRELERQAKIRKDLADQIDDAVARAQKATAASLQAWEETTAAGEKAAAAVGDLHLEAEKYIATLLGDELKKQELELEARLAKLRGAAAKADQRGDTGGADRLRNDANEMQRAANAARVWREQLAAAGTPIEQIGVASERTADATSKTAHAIADAVRGALDLADAFGLADASLSGIVSGLTQIIGNIGPLKEALTMRTSEVAGTGWSDVIMKALPVAGGIAAVISSITGNLRRAGDDAIAAQVAFEKATVAWNTAFDDFVSGLAASALDKQLADLRQKGLSLAEGATSRASAAGYTAEAAFTSAQAIRQFVERNLPSPSGAAETLRNELLGVAAAMERNAEAARALAKEQEETLTFDLRVRQLRAAGMDDEADALDLWNRQREEWFEAGRKGYSEETMAELQRTQEMERQALAAQQAADAQAELTRAQEKMAESAERAAERISAVQDRAAGYATRMAEATEDLGVRLLRAQGQTEEADRRADELQRQRELRAVQREIFEMSREISKIPQQWIGPYWNYQDYWGGPMGAEVQAANAEKTALLAMIAQAQQYLRDLQVVQTAEAAAIDRGNLMPGATASGPGSESSFNTVMSRTTAIQGDRMVDELTTIRTLLAEHLPRLAPPGPLVPPDVYSSGSSRLNVTVHQSLTFSGSVSDQDARHAAGLLSDTMLRQIEVYLGRRLNAATNNNGGALIS